MKIQVIKKSNAKVQPISSCPFMIDMPAEPGKKN
jgi:hypothetical protein